MTAVIRSRRVLLSVRWAWVLAAVLSCLSAWALLAGSGIDEVSAPRAEDGQGDLALYARIAERVASDEPYYDAAVAEQYAHGYPTSPAPAIRLPTVTYLAATLGDGALWGFRALLVAVAVSALLRFERLAPTRLEWFGAAAVAAVSLGMFADPQAFLFADAWAGSLIALSLYVYRRDRWWWSLGVGLAAVLVRELAVPYLGVMGVLAWRRNRVEALSWWTAGIAFVPIYALHWWAAIRAARTGGIAASDGWLSFGGWPHVVDTFRDSSILIAAPYTAAVLAVAAAVAGWSVVDRRWSVPVLATACTFMALFMMAGRPDTAYWGLLYAPVFAPGAVFFPRFLLALRRSGRPE